MGVGGHGAYGQVAETRMDFSLNPRSHSLTETCSSLALCILCPLHRVRPKGSTGWDNLGVVPGSIDVAESQCAHRMAEDGNNITRQMVHYFHFVISSTTCPLVSSGIEAAE